MLARSRPSAPLQTSAAWLRLGITCGEFLCACAAESQVADGAAIAAAMSARLDAATRAGRAQSLECLHTWCTKSSPGRR